MPLFFQHEVDNDTRLAIWHITEDEDFFDVPLQRAITHPHKRLQHRAGRYLLRYLFPEFPLELILVADTRRPFLENESFHFSISHCEKFAAAIVSRSKRVGIDIELPVEKVQRIRHKFIGEVEEIRLSELQERMPPVLCATLVWSVKEASFKWYGNGKVDFKKDMSVHIVLEEAHRAFVTGLVFGKEVKKTLAVYTRFLPPLTLSFIAEV
ncbi:MAG: 4'-phosphopantetheinyl transferase superfamily protein [Chitinophagaceae bacterium]|nr:MAG: 4'-phosphopantetheinyl transferase superfamily protein [Chitinophagaceae bacterium]